MTRYLARRLIMVIPVLLGVTLLTFAISHLTPGDPVELMLGTRASPERIAEIREQLGLNDPLWEQYGRFLWNALHGDLGRSIRSDAPVAEEILSRLPSTLELALAGMVIAMVLGVSAGVIAATTKRKAVDAATMVGALAGLSIPSFWLAILFILLFGTKLRWVSVLGGGGFRNLLLPAICVGLAPAAVIARLTRSSILEVARQEYVRTARAKGLRERTVTSIHILRNALIPVVTVMGLQLGYLLGGAVFVESVFARPGLGRFAIGAIAARDYPQVQGVVLITAVTFVLMNVVVDASYSVIDPRIRYE